MPGPLLDVQMSFCVAGARDCAPCQESKVSKTWGFCSISKNDGRHGTFEEDLQRCIFRASAVQETCSSELLGGPGADFLRGVAFWSIRSSGITFSWQAQYFRQVEWNNRKTHWYEAVSSALNFLFLQEVSKNCFVFDVVNFKRWGGLADLFRFWRCQVQKLRKSRRIAAFFDVAKFKSWGCLAEKLRFQACR